MGWTPLPIGIENYAEMIEKGYYYVDKTLFIKELLDRKGKVNLFTRPRRFGKTLNMSMLQYFFEKSRNPRTNLPILPGHPGICPGPGGILRAGQGTGGDHGPTVVFYL